MKKTPRSQLITSFELEPVDGQPSRRYQPGQYLAILLKPEARFEYQEIRQYSLICKADGKGYRIAVKREEGGQVSSWLHKPCQRRRCGSHLLPRREISSLTLSRRRQSPRSPAASGKRRCWRCWMRWRRVASSGSGELVPCGGNGDAHALADEVKAFARRCRRLPLTSGIAPRLRPTVRLDVLIAGAVDGFSRQWRIIFATRRSRVLSLRPGSALCSLQRSSWSN